MGCVARYNSSGLLTLQHAYPPPPSPCPTALVDVNLLLDTLKGTDTTVGEWVNVMGYVETNSTRTKVDNKKNRDHVVQNGVIHEQQSTDISSVRVQAVVLWSAGSVKLAEYENALVTRLSLEKVANN